MKDDAAIVIYLHIHIGLPSLYPSPAIKGHFRGDVLSFSASQCLEKCMCVLFFFSCCLVSPPAPLLFDCVFTAQEVSWCLIGLQLKNPVAPTHACALLAVCVHF
ncbi:hypothetical protein CHARACLAT_021707 [Characodon lateralis]|uniref:Uncharacterized protein n=1 Tax=Characodon lateralis TaxID=208331 RepID=A0ABU7DB60_9TELE|nr:hypothetical protein [Characodon lateralis]